MCHKSIWVFCLVFSSTQGRLKLKGAGSLQIFNVQPFDAGTYSCRSNNLEDSIDAEATLTVLGNYQTLTYNH